MGRPSRRTHRRRFPSRRAGSQSAADEIVWRGDADRALHPRRRLQRFETGGHIADTDHADDDARFPFDRMDLISELPNPFADMLDFLLGRVRAHRNNHGLTASPYSNKKPT